MSRRSIKRFLCVCIVTVSAVTSISYGTEVLNDLRDSLNSWVRANQDLGNMGDLPKAAIYGDIYERAHANAELDFAQPTIDALELTYQRIAENCGGNIDANHITRVFSQTSYGADLGALMVSRNLIDRSPESDYAKSCTEIVKCYYKEELEAAGQDINKFDAYTASVRNACETVVVSIHNSMLLHVTTEQTAASINYGDEMFANGSLDDSHYDLLVTIGDIGDILFSKNESPSQVSYYDNDLYEFYDIPEEGGSESHPDPDVVEEYDLIDPSELTNSERLPDTSGVVSGIPKEVTGSYSPPTEAPEGRVQGGFEDGIDQSGGGVIQNNICVAPVPFTPERDDLLESAEKEREYVYERNAKLDLDDIVAVLLGSKVAPEIEQLLGTDDVIPEELFEQAQETANEVVEEIVDLGADSLQDFEDHVKGCVEEFTEHTSDKREKILRKSITQPTAFTKCVMEGMCKEVGDESQLGLYRVKICQIPGRAYNVNANQSVKSIEEIVDELSNVCFGLRESGQLLKHNKTKDHWTHKLMEIQIGDKLGFGLTVGFQGPPSGLTDEAAEKRKTIEANKFFTSFTLGFNEDLTYKQEKNKYSLLFNTAEYEVRREDDIPTSVATKDNFNDTTAGLKTLSAPLLPVEINLETSLGSVIIQQQTNQQQRIYVESDSVLQEFVKQNTEYRRFAGEHTKSIQENWKATYDKFKKN